MEIQAIISPHIICDEMFNDFIGAIFAQKSSA